MFFMRLRRRAKWIFFLLVFAFAFSFLFAGVGSGGSAGDIVQQLLGMRGTDAVSSAEKEVRDNPKSVSAWTRLAQLYSDDADRRDDAIRAYNKLISLDPKDIGALAQLSALWESITLENWDAYSKVEQEISVTSGPGDTGNQTLQNWIGVDPLRSSYQNTLLTQAGETYNSYQKAARSWEKVAKKYLEATPKGFQRAPAQLQLGQAAASAGHTAAAIKAYKEFLRLAPNSPYASAVKDTLENLQKASAKG